VANLEEVHFYWFGYYNLESELIESTTYTTTYCFISEARIQHPCLLVGDRLNAQQSSYKLFIYFNHV
jgi:hypothetical protein